MIRHLSVVVGTDRPELRKAFDPVQVANFERITGLKKTRRYDGTATQLAIEAAKQASMLGRVSDIRRLIVVTQSQDRSSPCMAVDVHRVLGLPSNVACFDMNQSCDGFIYGAWLADMMETPTLVVCVDKLRASPDKIDSLIFSDGACAFVVEPTETFNPQFDEAMFHTNGAGAEHLCSDTNGLLKMDGGKVFDFVTRNVPEFIKRYNASGRYELLAQHQPNLSMMRIVESRSGFQGKSLHSVEEYGNMSMVSVAAALAHNEERILGKNVLLCGYGAGWCAGLMGVPWPTERISHIVEVGKA